MRNQNYLDVRVFFCWHMLCGLWGGFLESVVDRLFEGQIFMEDMEMAVRQP